MRDNDARYNWYWAAPSRAARRHTYGRAMVAAAKPHIEYLTVQHTATELAGGDVVPGNGRAPEERLQAGGLPTAIHAPR